MGTVASIQKITKAMKMVASAKMRGDKRRMEVGMPFVNPVSNLMQRLQVADASGPVTLLGVTSDKGLCGGVNSAVNKQCKLTILGEEGKGNAGEMLEKLTLIYNRARQAKITTELCEIISGASAL